MSHRGGTFVESKTVEGFMMLARLAILGCLVLCQCSQPAEGPPGVAGASGPVGASGPSGAAGTPGPAGSAGAVGATGVEGPRGPEGPQGPQGPQGPPGTPGTSSGGGGITKSGLYVVTNTIGGSGSPGTSLLALCANNKDVVLTGGCKYTNGPVTESAWEAGSRPINAADPNSRAGWECSAYANAGIFVTATAVCLTVP